MSSEDVVTVDIPVDDKGDSTVVHLMPCGIDTKNDNGVAEAKVNCYFTSTIKEESPNVFRASFRGRPLHGALVTLPDNYKGVVLKEQGTAVAGVTYNTVGHFSSLYYWNLDKNISQDDPVHRCLQWTKLSNAIHQKV